MQSCGYEQLRKERDWGEGGKENQVTVRDELSVDTFYWCITWGSCLHRRFCSSFSPLGALSASLGLCLNPCPEAHFAE